MFLVFHAIALTILALEPSCQEWKSITLIRKWAHSLNSYLFFIYFWQTILYIFVLRDRFQELRLLKGEPAWVTDLNERVTLLPHLCLLANWLLTDMALLRQHGNLVLQAFAAFQMFNYFVIRNKHSDKRERVWLDVVMICALVGICAVPQWLMCWLS